jgi:glycosyltransferase involved in cell wall biosynthesis
MRRRHKATFVTIVPSPYQRDLFAALAARDDVELRVCYMEAASPDSPWPEKPLRSFERIMPGFWVPFGGARGHVNWRLPDASQSDVTVLSSFTSLTGQYLMHGALRKTPWIFWGERLRENTGLKEFTQRSLVAPLRRAAAIVGIGRAAEEDYRRRFPNVAHFCIPYYCDLSAFLAVRRTRHPAAPTTFLFCGQMIARKGVDLLLAAFDRLVATGASVQLLLVGREADLPRFMQMASPPTREKIRYEGFQAPESLPKYFGMSDVFILPSRHDGWGVVVNQALAAGLPVITSDAVGAGLDLVEDGVNGICVAANDVEALYRALEKFALNPTIAARWGRHAREKALTITPEAGARKWVQVFDTLLTRNLKTVKPERESPKSRADDASALG